MWSWKLFALGSALFAGVTAVLAKIGVKDIPSNVATLIRTVVILIFLAAVVYSRKEWRPLGSWESKSLVFLVLSGLATGLSWMCYYRALQLGPASLVAPLDKLSLVVAIVLAVLVLGERLTLWHWAGATCVTVGVLILAIK